MARAILALACSLSLFPAVMATLYAQDEGKPLPQERRAAVERTVSAPQPTARTRAVADVDRADQSDTARFAQGASGRRRGAGGEGGATTGRAVPREQPRAEQPRTEQPRSREPQGRARQPSNTGSDAAASEGRDRGGRPATGQAVQRTRPRQDPDRTVYVPYYRRGYGYDPYYGYRYGYPYYPWGYGGFGLGYFYYDPYYWNYPSYGQSYPYYSAFDDTGELRLKVKPREAQVWVDGYFAGEVDQYDGVFQHLNLEPGSHRIEIRANGYAPLSFDVRIMEGRKITYEGELQRQP
jgi:hypothetical protein